LKCARTSAGVEERKCTRCTEENAQKKLGRDGQDGQDGVIQEDDKEMSTVLRRDACVHKYRYEKNERTAGLGSDIY
jgi:hypothetical protein